jgi:segregation and condensation protein B
LFSTLWPYGSTELLNFLYHYSGTSKNTMSLKAKLEAVIYAAEEPVTLAQLSTLFAADALEWKREQRLALGEVVEEPEAIAGVQEQLPVVDEAEEQAEAGEEDDAPAKNAAESELKKQAKLRDREVREILKEIIGEVADEYVREDRGIEVREIAGGYRMATKPEYHDAVRAFIKSLKPPLKLSLPALETLAVIAYKQPVTAPEVSEIRGVDTSGVLGSLMSRKLITTAGRKQVIGRPILYRTTKDFLVRFGLKDLAELPSMEEFEKLAAVELEEPVALGPEPSALEQAAVEDSSRPEFEENVDEEQEPNEA